ncbi:hypothetical protein SAMN05428944_2374 [Streptomyces sp. 1222.5]|uniref:hypothetical protein n=1 Tax=unclassified Streptomyces TaxID=2593676 RepID=UPI00089CC7B9|nr:MULTISPECIES: hypothetical protein [unclassified Streptomyces]PKW10438.1 hypothetical protein BX260_5720 [Streptomyces sp. 5112.2]SEC06125.1 hypothetical protein SAMN05428944_2374 [Streptomyces sp. 1222.5]SED85873.1 hypothetical protein SAMN05216532_5995 [Streptomyces sp. 2231.1]
MAWDEWEQLKSDALTRQQGGTTHMRLNQLPSDPGGSAAAPSQTGDLKVTQHDLTKIGGQAHTLYNHLWDKARLSNTSVDSAAGDLTKQGFALGAGLSHVSIKWDSQLNSLLDACAQISNHMQVTKKIHAGDDAYIQRQMSSIDTLDDGFDERVGGPGKHNPVYGSSESPKKN